MKTNSSATLYNKYTDPTTRTERWQRTVLPAVMWENRKAANVLRTGGQIAADQARIFIPSASGANYLDPIAWQALSTKTGKWTLQSGDVIVKGTVTDELHPAVVSPPSAAFTVSDLKAAHPDVLIISSIDTMDMGSANMNHWQVGAS